MKELFSKSRFLLRETLPLCYCSHSQRNRKLNFVELLSGETSVSFNFEIE